MKTVGIIAEYNPFHNGHAYHLQKARELCGADFVVVVMSGDFVQRGTPAIINKYVRAEMALQGGADLILELPVRYATGSSEYFATGAISLLESLGVVGAVCFGSERGNVEPIKRIADVLVTESAEYCLALREELKKGRSYPTAREQALIRCHQDAAIKDILTHPNNLLGIEYCKALRKLQSSIQPLTIRRLDSNYHDRRLSEKYSSASALRFALQKDGVHRLKGQIPEMAYAILSNHLERYDVSDIDDYSQLLRYKLMLENPESLLHYSDITKEMSNRIYTMINGLDTYKDFIKQMKTRNITYTRAARSLLHILLNIPQYALYEHSADNTPYARILGFRKDSENLLGAIKNRGSIPLISKLADRKSLLSDSALTLLEEDIWCANLYESVLAQRLHTPFIHEASYPIRVV